jgi:uncharacterized glyoxalase superfamily protein PhnB
MQSLLSRHIDRGAASLHADERFLAGLEAMRTASASRGAPVELLRSHAMHRPASSLVVITLLFACQPAKQPTTPPSSDSNAKTSATAQQPAKPKVAPVPAGFFAITPQLIVADVDDEIDFCVAAFGAEKVVTIPGPSGDSVHGEVRIGDSIVMIDEENVGQNVKSPTTLEGTTATIVVYVADAEAAVAAAKRVGATVEAKLEEQFWGDRTARVRDKAGHRWLVSTHVEELSVAQLLQRAELVKGKKKAKKSAWKAIAGQPAPGPVPRGKHSAVLALTSNDAATDIDFYVKAFAATEIVRVLDAAGKVVHAELKVDDSILVVRDEGTAFADRSPHSLHGSPVDIHYYTADVDAVFARATAGGAKVVAAVEDKFWGDRFGAFVGPSRFLWEVATRIEDVSPEELERRMAAQSGDTQ